MNCFNKTNQQFRDGWNEWIQEWKDVEWKRAFKSFYQNGLPVIVGFASFLAFATIGVIYVLPALAETIIKSEFGALAFAITDMILAGIPAFYFAVLCHNCANQTKES